MFPPPERFSAVFAAIEPVLRMAYAGERGLFNSRRRNAMLLAADIVEARKQKDKWESTGDYYHCKRAHEALVRGAKSAMKGARLDLRSSDESTFWIVYSLLDAGIVRPHEHPLAAAGDVEELAEQLLRQMQQTSKTQHGVDMFDRRPGAA